MAELNALAQPDTVPQVNSNQGQRKKPRARDGEKRDRILASATERFGRDGYEDTKWADIAADVGVGPTALYHYFESKQHCLFVIMDDAVAGFRRRFDAIIAAEPDPLRALTRVIADLFDLTEHDVQRNRLLVAEQGLLARARTSPREEQARQAVRARMRDLEFAWASFIARAMDQGVVPARDPRLLVRGVVGLYNSIWQWYRPNGIIALDDAAAFFTDRILAMIGVDADALESARLAA
jgi:TetR/AcrR family transcriptional regulator, cholesterol catabolism regulator